MLTQCTSSTTTSPIATEPRSSRKPAWRRRSGAAYTIRFSPAATAATRAAVSSGASDEFTKVAVGATPGGSLSTWSFMRAMSGESTSVGSGRSIAASWYVSDLPEPVGISASVSRPSTAARTTSSCPGRNESKPKRSRSGAVRSLRRASIGAPSNGALLPWRSCYADLSGCEDLRRACGCASK